jgi:hypothetical protein
MERLPDPKGPYVERVKEKLRKGERPDVVRWKGVAAALNMSEDALLRMRRSGRAKEIPVFRQRNGVLVSFVEIILVWASEEP